MARPRRDSCKYGHALVKTNLYFFTTKTGYRQRHCKQCRAARYGQRKMDPVQTVEESATDERSLELLRFVSQAPPEDPAEVIAFRRRERLKAAYQRDMADPIKRERMRARWKRNRRAK